MCVVVCALCKWWFVCLQLDVVVCDGMWLHVAARGMVLYWPLVDVAG